ncbi:hypothetical protein BM1_00137 [Bipolaris maydis]|nr:hypothetical protein BM1_00137 [Bipolaris maydis]
MSDLGKKKGPRFGGDFSDSPTDKVKQWFDMVNGFEYNGHDAIVAKILKLESVTYTPSSEHPHDARTVFSFVVPEELCNIGGNLHGGAVALIFDITTSLTILPCGREGFWDGGNVSRNRQLHVPKAGAGRFDHLCGKLGCASGQAHGSDHGDDEAGFEGWKGLLYLRAWESESGRIQYVRGWNRISVNYKFSVNAGVENLSGCDTIQLHPYDHKPAPPPSFVPYISSPRQWIWATQKTLPGAVQISSLVGNRGILLTRFLDVPSQSSPAPGASKQLGHDDAPQDASSTTTTTTTLTVDAAPSAASAPRSPAGRGPRRRPHGVQSTKLEAVEDPLGPLGAPTPSPGLEPVAPPAPPQKEAAAHGTRPAGAASASSSLRGMMDSVDLDDNDQDQLRASQGARLPPPVQAPSQPAPQRQTQPSVSVEQAAKPSFSISVGDPHKVGDLTSSHTEYSVTTKTTSKGYRNPEFTVSRRYRDFLWLYNQLHNNNPGVIIPPPPEKQAVGRFDADFVESRRAALERMLNKSAAHPVLQHDSDLKLFLESEAFNMDIKNKERKDPGLGENKGMFGSMLGSSSGKFIEHDDWFHDRRVYLDALEAQLKALLKATDTVVSQRKGLAEACGDFSASLHSLSAVELSPALSGPLDSLSDIQIRIRELYERQAQQDVLTMGIVIDEYIRLIGSVKTAFQQRQKAYHSWHSAEQELQKRKATQDKLLRQGRSQQDRLNQLSADVADAERKVHQARLLFDDMGRLMRSELERFEREKVEDFKSGVETFLESAVEAQKELIEIWETFLMQLDTDEGEGFSLPAGVIASSTTDQASNHAPAHQDSEEAEENNQGVSSTQA